MEKSPLPLPGTSAGPSALSVAAQLVAAAPRAAPFVLLLRHAAREEIRGIEDGWTAPLTDPGRAEARRTGEQLRAAGVLAAQAWSSPSPRCVETASLLLRGLGVDDAVGPDPRFGGPYVLDNERAFRRMLQLGNAIFLRAWFDGGWVDAMQPAQEAAEAQLQSLVTILDQPGPRARIVVTHDWNIALLRDRILQSPHEERGLPAFLDGLLLFATQGRVGLLDRGIVRWQERP